MTNIRTTTKELPLIMPLQEESAAAVKKRSKTNGFERDLGATMILFLLTVFLFNKIFVLYTSGLSLLLAYGFAVIAIYIMVFTTALFFYKDPALRGKELRSFDKNELPLVSCMVAVFNEEEHIADCLDAIFAQDYENIEVIVVNDASTDNTLQVLVDYEKTHPQLLVINLEKNGGKKFALSQAMLNAKGSLFAHTDSDSRWDKRAISKIVRIFLNNPKVGAVSGHGRARNSEKNILTKMQDAWMEGQFSVRKSFESVFKTVSCVSGPLAVFRKEAVYNFLPAWMYDSFLGQPFKFATDRTLTGFVLGSKWLHKKAMVGFGKNPFSKTIYPAQKWDIVYCKSARSYTEVPNTFSKMLKQQARWKKSFIRNIFLNGPFFWRRSFPVAVVYYSHIIFVFLAPFIILHVLFLSGHNPLVALAYYALSVIVIGFFFALALKFEDKECRHWFYRPLMSVFSTVVLSWLIFYSMVTIRKMTWHRG